MLKLVLKTLNSGRVERVFFDTFKVDEISSYEIIPHYEENFLEFSSGNDLFGSKTILINLNSVTKIEYTKQAEPDAG